MHEAAKRHLVAEQAERNRRAAKPLDCPRCGAPCLRGEDDDDAAARVTVDAEPIDPVDEMLALFDGRLTYDLLPQRGKGAGTYALHLRYPHHYLSAKPPGGTVHLQHRCDGKANRETLVSTLW